MFVNNKLSLLFEFILGKYNYKVYSHEEESQYIIKLSGKYLKRFRLSISFVPLEITLESEVVIQNLQLKQKLHVRVLQFSMLETSMFYQELRT
jgi:hypothetical protein